MYEKKLKQLFVVQGRDLRGTDFSVLQDSVPRPHAPAEIYLIWSRSRKILSRARTLPQKYILSGPAPARFCPAPARSRRNISYLVPLPQDSVPRPHAPAEIYLNWSRSRKILSRARTLPQKYILTDPAPARDIHVLSHSRPHKSNLYRFFFCTSNKFT